MSTDTSAMRDLATRIDAEATALSTSYQNLLNICGDLLAVWDGVAATSFNDYLQEAGAPLQNLINFLEESKINLNQAADNYDEAESSNTIR